MSRKLARENVYLLIFEYLFNKEKNNQTLEILFMNNSLTDEDKNYISTVYNGTIENFLEIEELIKTNVNLYSYDRIYKPDLAVMFLSIYELKFMKDIPPAVSICEAVDIVKKYSTEKSNNFVNGVLSKLNKIINEV